jgi:uncharacterized membrane protein YphA (DoxX/SURF4 family)
MFALPNILIAAYFLASSYQDFKDKDHIVTVLKNREIPSPDMGFIGLIAWKVIFAIGLLYRPAVILSSCALILFMIVGMYMFRNFWQQTGMEKEISFRLFITDVAVIGGLIALL